MPDIAYFDNKYKEKAPWDLNIVEPLLIEWLEKYNIIPCLTIDIGCGSATDSIYMADKGFNIIAIDSSELAYNKAKEKTKEKNNIIVIHKNFLELNTEPNKISFAYDRGMWQHNSNEKGIEIAIKIHSLLKEDGL